MISRDAARKAWLSGLRNPHEKSCTQLPSPSKREFETWVVESYEALHAEIFGNRKLKPQYFFATEMYAYIILKNWKSRIGFGEGKVEDLRQVLDYETYFYLWAFLKYREDEGENDWIASSLEDRCVHINDGETSRRLLEILDEAWDRAFEFYLEGIADEDMRKWFSYLNSKGSDSSYKTWWIRKMSRESEDFRRWFAESGLAREAYRLLEYEDKPEIVPIFRGIEDEEEEDEDC